MAPPSVTTSNKNLAPALSVISIDISLEKWDKKMQ